MPSLAPPTADRSPDPVARPRKNGAAGWVLGLLGGLLYALAVWVGQGLHLSSSLAPVLWPASGVALAWWLCLGWRSAPGLLLGGLLGHGLVALAPRLADLGPVSLGALGLTGAELACAAMAAQALRQLPQRLGRHPIRQAARYTTTALAAAAASTALQGGVLWQLGLLEPYPTWLARIDVLGGIWLAKTGALLLNTPPLLILLNPALRRQGERLLAFPMQSTGLGLTVLAVALAGQMQFEAQMQDFRGQVRALAMALQNHVDMALRDLEVIRAFHYKVEIDQSEFHAVADPMLEQSPWQLHFAWLPRILNDERNLFEDSPLGLDGSAIRQVNPQGALIRSPTLASYYPVRWTEPVAGHEALIGVDEASDAVRGPALRQAALTGRITATPPYASLERAATDLSVVTLYAPVLTGDLRQTHGHDPDRVRGMVAAVLDMGELIRLSSLQMEIDGIDLLLNDAQTPGSAGVQAHLTTQVQQIQSWRPGHPPAAAGRSQARQTVKVADHSWTLLAHPTRLGPALWPSVLQWAVLCCGLAFTALLTAFVLTRLRHEQAMLAANDRLEDQVRDRTHELATTNGQLQTEVEERRRLEGDLRQASQRAEHANQAKSLFLANMSHEIRTPLNAVIGYTQILLEDRSLAAQTRERLRTILQAGQRLLRLINDVLDLSKIEAGGLQLHSELFDLRQELADAATLFDQRARTKGLAMQVDLALAAPSPVRTDRSKLGQVVLNLLGNALKFTEHGQISLSARREGDDVVIDVRDSGPGIGAAELAQLFAPFRQGQAGREKGGTGLGLVLSRHIARSMGGDLVLLSEPGAGTHARLRLPLAHDTAGSMAAPDSEQLRQLSPLTPLRALVVDDDEHSRDILVQLLLGIGCQVDSARDGLEGLRAAHRGGFQIIFTDIRMPVLDGLQMLRQLRATPGGAQLPVVAVSASSLEHERRHYIAEGFSDFVGKPYAFGEIYRMLARHAGARFEQRIDSVPLDDHAGKHDRAGPAAARQPGPQTLAALQNLVDAAGHGDLHRVSALIKRLAETGPGTVQASGYDTVLDALPQELLERMQLAAQHYDFAALESQAREVLDSVPPHPAPALSEPSP